MKQQRRIVEHVVSERFGGEPAVEVRLVTGPGIPDTVERTDDAGPTPGPNYW